MQYKWLRLKALLRSATMLSAAMPMLIAPAYAATAPQADYPTRSPIKHVIVIIGENRTFDHLFSTYVPPSGDQVRNSLSEGIVNADGTPGPNYAAATQMQASDTTAYSISPATTGPYATLPPTNTAYTPTAQSTTAPPFTTVGIAAQYDYGVLPDDLVRLTTGASGLAQHTIDTRIANVNNLAPGPYQLSPGITTDDYANSPVHRFYQMFQQLDCNVSYATTTNPSGCRADLFPWVEVTIGAGNNGSAQPSGFNDESTGEGAVSMGFYNVQQGDAPYLTKLAQEYTLLDNYHQAVKGGTGVDHLYLGYADDLWYSDGNGNVATPPTNEIENPNPQPNTNNWYTQDGYSGGSYSNCSNKSEPGVASVAAYLKALNVARKCASGHYYLLNNYNPGYLGDGTVLSAQTSPYTIPPSPVRSIGDALNAKGISWAYFGEGWNQYVADPTSPTNVYCNICNPFQYETSIMTGTDPVNGAPLRVEHLKDTTDLYNDLVTGELPAVSYVKPGGLNDGHPESSKISVFEAFVKKVLLSLKANKKLSADTAVMITFDEGGGYWDSGYVQQVDFFGDGTRVPMIIVSPWTRGGHVSHVYSDHASVVKFIEANWGLPPITRRSRDNLPNPIQESSNPYVPVNGPSISDMMQAFRFR